MVLANATANATVDLLSQDGTPNGIFIHSIFQYIGGSAGVLSDSIIFWVFAILVFIVSYEILTRFFLDMKKSTKIILAFLPPLLLDLLISFGRFDFSVPIIGQTFTIERGVMFLTMFDNIFTYKFFIYYTSGIINPFISNASIDSSWFMYILTLLYTTIDSILEFIFLSWLVYSLITIYEDYTQEKIDYQLPISVIIALIPVLLYSIFVSNPFKEADTMLLTFNGLLAFAQSGQIFDIIYVVVLFVINLLIMATIVFVAIELIFSIYFKVYYGKKEIEHLTDFGGMALMYTLAYSVIFLMHSEYKWYVFFPMMVIYSYLRKATSGVVDGAKVRIDEKNKINKITGMAMERSRNEYASETSVTSRRRKELNGDEFDMRYVIISIVLVIVALVVYYIYYGNGILDGLLGL